MFINIEEYLAPTIDYLEQYYNNTPAPMSNANWEHVGRFKSFINTTQFEYFSAGSFSVLFTSDELPGIVFKIGRLNDGCLKYYKYAKQQQSNPHIIKLYSEILELQHLDCYLVAIELLPILTFRDAPAVFYLTRRHNQWFTGVNCEEKLERNRVPEKHHQLYYTALDVVHNCGGTNDVHGMGNIRQRSDGTYVLVDPVY